MMEGIGRQQQAASCLAADPEHRPIEACAATSTGPVGHAWRALIEANQVMTALIGDAASRQQDFAFLMVRATLSAFPGPVKQVGQFWAAAMASQGEACRRGFGAMQALAGGTSSEATRAHGEPR